MRAVETVPLAPSTRNGGSFPPRPEVIFQARDFGPLCRLIWRKPDTAIALIAGVSDRAARDYLNGSVAPPQIVLSTILYEVSIKLAR